MTMGIDPDFAVEIKRRTAAANKEGLSLRLFGVLQMFGWSPGTYNSICHTCEDQFVGDKRAIMCKPCGLASVSLLGKEARNVATDTTPAETKPDDDSDKRVDAAMYPAAFIVHWPGQSVYVCLRHKDALQRIGGSMGAVPAAQPYFEGKEPCKNCMNEALTSSVESGRVE